MISQNEITNLQFMHGASTNGSQQELVAALTEVNEAVIKHRTGQQALFKKNKAKTTLLDISEGKIVYENPELKAKAISRAESAIHHANSVLINLGTIQYHRPMMLMLQYCLKCKENLLAEQNKSQYDTVLNTALHNLENLLDNLQGARKGTTNGVIFNRSSVQSYERLLQVEAHLQDRLQGMTKNRLREVGQVTQLPIVQSVLSKADNLPEDSFVLFFEKGALIQKQGHDERFYTQTFDIDRLRKNDGRLDRLIGHEPDGYVVIRAMLDFDGNPKISKTGGRVLKEVIDFDGAVPETVVKGMDLGLLLKRYK